MAVHRTGLLAPVAGDLQTTHKGVQIALKMIDWGSGIPVYALIEKKATGWEASIIEEFGDRSDGKVGYAYEAEVERVGSIANWIKQILLPKINAALLARFPKTGTTTAATDKIGTLDAQIIAALQWLPQADGTIKVGVK